MKFRLFSLSALATAALGAQNSLAATIHDVTFLKGCWTAKNEVAYKYTITEDWFSASANGMMGVSQIRGNYDVLIEHGLMDIELNEFEEPILTMIFPGHPTYTFIVSDVKRAADGEVSSVTFSTKDSPELSKMIYTQVSPTKRTIRYIGQSAHGWPSDETIEYAKSDCATRF